MNEYSFYPNPVTDEVTIEVAEPALVSIVNMQDVTVWRAQIQEVETISLKHLPAGLYIVSLITKNKIHSKRLIRQ